jgi:hypothetical protein
MTKVFFQKPFSKITNQRNLTAVGSTDTSFEIMINSTGDIFVRHTQTYSALNKLIPELVACGANNNTVLEGRKKAFIHTFLQAEVTSYQYRYRISYTQN